MSETTQGQSAAASLDGEPAGWTLIVIGRGELRAFAVPGPEATIGRDADADVCLDHARISRRHARLRLGARCTIEDLGSRNGTVVRGVPLARGAIAELTAGDSVGLGPFTAVLAPSRPGAPPAALTVEDPAPASPPPALVTFARSPATVLIRGESGTGKEVLAETLHRLSGRAGPLLRLNCAGFHPELLESELFGHERGAFTGAVAAKAGLLEAAAGGTVFLDEIGELPAALQARILRAIEAREILRVGATRPLAIDVRFLAATHRDLPAEIARGAFRLDLYYRIAVITLSLPPLRARPARIVHLAQVLLASIAAASGRAAPRLGPAALARLQAHAWPGNVRELRNTLERATLLAGDVLGAEHIVLDAAPVLAAAPAAAPTGTPPPDAAPARDPAERARILEALDQCVGNQTRAAKLLGMSRATLAVKLALHNIRRPRAR